MTVIVKNVYEIIVLAVFDIFIFMPNKCPVFLVVLFLDEFVGIYIVTSAMSL